ncbi:MAG: 50S ribosomal protein L25/general stress protein Ctc [Elainellaceae cyanobacterium]
MELSIDCQTRSPESKAKALRREGLIPAVLYGHKGAESISICVGAKDAETLVRKASVNNTLVEVNVSDLPWNGKVIIREVHTHPAKGYLYHLSFFSVASQASLEVTVPLHFVGDPIGVREEKGVLDTPLNELQVRCDPASIPEFIEVDVTNLKVGENLHISDITMPAGVEPAIDADRTLASIFAQRKAATDEETTVTTGIPALGAQPKEG